MPLPAYCQRLSMVIALGVSLTACGQSSENTDATQTSVERAVVTQADSEQALALFGLQTPGRASWSDRQFEDGAYIFTDFTLTDADGVLQAETFTLQQPQVRDGGAFFTALRFETLQVRWPDGEMSVADFTLSAPTPLLAQGVALALRGAQTLEELDIDRAGYGFGQLTAHSVQSQDIQNKTERIRFQFDHLEASDYADGEHLGALDFSGFTFHMEDSAAVSAEMSLDRLLMTGVRLNQPDFDAPFAAPMITPGEAPLEQFDMTGLDITVAGAALTLPRLHGEVDTLEDDVLRSVMTMDRLEVRPNSDHPDGQAFREGLDILGYDAMVFSFSGESRYDPETDRAWTVGETALTLEDGLRISLDQDVSGLSAYTENLGSAAKEGADTNPAALIAPLMLHRFRLEIEDRSLMDRIMAYYAEQQGVTPEQARAQAGAMLAMGMAFAGTGLPDGVLPQASAALNAFITQGGVITIDMAPDTPVSMGSLMDGGAPDAATLGLSIQHKAGSDPATSPN